VVLVFDSFLDPCGMWIVWTGAWHRKLPGKNALIGREFVGPGVLLLGKG
jgi:hypothetical protein